MENCNIFSDCYIHTFHLDPLCPTYFPALYLNPYSARIRSVRNIFSHYLTSFIIRSDPLHPKIFSHASFLYYHFLTDPSDPHFSTLLTSHIPSAPLFRMFRFRIHMFYSFLLMTFSHDLCAAHISPSIILFPCYCLFSTTCFILVHPGSVV